MLYNWRDKADDYCMPVFGKYVPYVPNPSDSGLESMLAQVDSDIVLVGHDHSRTIRKVNNQWYINVGSLGCPGKERNIASAVLTIENSAVEIESVELVYDAESVVAEING